MSPPLHAELEKTRTFELLRKKGAATAVLEFNGGHDEGGVESILLFDAAGELVCDLEVWYCGYSNGDWIPISKPANEGQELSDLLQGPVDQTFGSWGSVASTSGICTWDVEAGTATLSYTQDEPAEYEEVF